MLTNGLRPFHDYYTTFCGWEYKPIIIQHYACSKNSFQHYCEILKTCFLCATCTVVLARYSVVLVMTLHIPLSDWMSSELCFYVLYFILGWRYIGCIHRKCNRTEECRRYFGHWRTRGTLFIAINLTILLNYNDINFSWRVTQYIVVEALSLLWIIVG